MREIAKRLIKGLEDGIPDLQERLDHIFHYQLFGLAITELTSLLSRRSLYYSKYPNSEFSVTTFDTAEGNIRYKRIEHTWKNGRCVFCRANKNEYDRSDDLETHAYEFIHSIREEEFFNMKFDVIISNPPYQLGDGGKGASSSPLYHKFIETSKKLKPRYLSMIVPSRWMTSGKGLGKFREEMLHDKHITKLHDFFNPKECFGDQDIKGGVCYFLWERDRTDECEIVSHMSNGVFHSKRYLLEGDGGVFVRDGKTTPIKEKAAMFGEKSFMEIVSSNKPYGLRTDFFLETSKYALPHISDSPIKGGYSILGLENLKRVVKYIPKNYPLPKRDGLNNYKVFIPASYGCGAIGEVMATPVLATPVLATPGELCTETFLQIGNFKTKAEAENCLKYIKTKFLRFLVGIRKITQHASRGVYAFVPLQDFTQEWTDEKLYAKYGLTSEEIDYIERVVTPME